MRIHGDGGNDVALSETQQVYRGSKHRASEETADMARLPRCAGYKTGSLMDNTLDGTVEDDWRQRSEDRSFSRCRTGRCVACVFQ